MPTYEYGCLSCGRKFDLFATLSQKGKGLKPECPDCGSKRVAQVFSGINFVKSSGRSADAAFRSAGGCGPNARPGCCG